MSKVSHRDSVFNLASKYFDDKKLNEFLEETPLEGSEVTMVFAVLKQTDDEPVLELAFLLPTVLLEHTLSLTKKSRSVLPYRFIQSISIESSEGHAELKIHLLGQGWYQYETFDASNSIELEKFAQSLERMLSEAQS